MSAAGTWRVTVLTRHFRLTLADAGLGSLTGLMQEEGKTEVLSVADGRQAGSTVSWKVDVPGYSATAHFTGRVAGNSMTGRVQAGLFAPTFRARRAKPAHTTT